MLKIDLLAAIFNNKLCRFVARFRNPGGRYVFLPLHILHHLFHRIELEIILIIVITLNWSMWMWYIDLLQVRDLWALPGCPGVPRAIVPSCFSVRS